MGILSNIQDLQNKGAHSKSDSKGINFFMVITGFDDKNQILKGNMLVKGKKPEEDEIKVRFSDYFNNLNDRPTYNSLRSGMGKCEVGYVYCVQQASLNNGVWEMRWGNIVSRDLNKTYVGQSPAIVFPLGGEHNPYQRVTILDSIDNICHSTDQIKQSIANIAAEASKKNALEHTSIMIKFYTGVGKNGLIKTIFILLSYTYNSNISKSRKGRPWQL